MLQVLCLVKCKTEAPTHACSSCASDQPPSSVVGPQAQEMCEVCLVEQRDETSRTSCARAVLLCVTHVSVHPANNKVAGALAVYRSPIGQRFSNFFDYGPLFSSGIVGGPPHLLQ